jgi:transposase IS66 family protein
VTLTVELDNHLVEKAIRPTALGKKNWLFIGKAARSSTPPLKAVAAAVWTGMVIWARR